MIFVVLTEIAACIAAFISYYYDGTNEKLALLILCFIVLIITIAFRWYKLDKNLKDIKQENDRFKINLNQLDEAYKKLQLEKEAVDQKITHFDKHKNDQKINADKRLFEEILKRVPHDHRLISWFKEKNLGERNIKFDYFDSVSSFKYDFDKGDIFFHDEELEKLFKKLLKDIDEFEKLGAQYMSPSRNGDGYEIARHTDRGSFDAKLDALERKKVEELNNSASQVYKSFEEFFKTSRQTLIV